LKDANIGEKVQDTIENIKNSKVAETVKDKYENLKEMAASKSDE